MPHKIVSCLAILLFATGILSAQDSRLSQYFVSPMNLNPALIGKSVGDWRLLGAHRSQWQGSGAEPYTTTTVSIEKNLFAGSTGNNVLGAGLMLQSDESNAGLLKRQHVTAGIAYNNAIDAEGKQFFGGGISVNYARRMLDRSKMLFQSQYGSGGYQPDIPANDNIALPSNSYIDINAGVHYSIRTDKYGFYIGAGYFHANKPKESIYENTEYVIDPRISLQAGYQLLFANNSELHISSIYEKQGNLSRFTGGLLYKLAVSGSGLSIKTINLGIWDRVGDAVYPYIGIEAGSWVLGMSYDVPVSTVANSLQNLQSFEISFGLQFGKRKMANVFAY